MLKNTLKNAVLASLLMFLPVNMAIAATTLSWNLQLDLRAGMATNPKGVWAFMQSIPSNKNPAKYRLLPTYQNPCDLSRWNVPATPVYSCWQDLASHSVISVPIKGTPNVGVHPGINNQVILRWQSPIAGNISITGGLTDSDPACGDGIKWYLRTESTILKEAVLANGKSATFSLPGLPVKKSARLYLVIDKGKNNWCDATDIAFNIKQLTTVTPSTQSISGGRWRYYVYGQGCQHPNIDEHCAANRVVDNVDSGINKW